MHFLLATNDTLDPGAAMAAMGAMMGIIGIAVLVFTALFVWMFWRIFEKAGYAGALGLLCLIPSVGPLVCLLILAFGEWPAHRVMPQYQPQYPQQ